MQVFFPICFSLCQHNYTESMCGKHITFTYEWIPNGNLVETRTRENHCSKATKETQQECTWSLFYDFFCQFRTDNYPLVCKLFFGNNSPTSSFLPLVSFNSR